MPLKCSIQYDRYCLVGIAIFLVGAVYWAGWWIVLPKIFGYNLVSHKEYLEDGTVVNVVRLTSYLSLRYTLKLFRLVQKGEACLEYADFL